MPDDMATSPPLDIAPKQEDSAVFALRGSHSRPLAAMGRLAKGSRSRLIAAHAHVAECKDMWGKDWVCQHSPNLGILALQWSSYSISASLVSNLFVNVSTRLTLSFFTRKTAKGIISKVIPITPVIEWIYKFRRLTQDRVGLRPVAEQSRWAVLEVHFWLCVSSFILHSRGQVCCCTHTQDRGL
jgi:hypothetical protein